MSLTLLESVWNSLSSEKKASLGPVLAFICIGGRQQGKTTFIQRLGVHQKEDLGDTTLWTTACGNTTCTFYEQSSFSSLLPSPTVPSCILLFSKFLQEQTGNIQEIRNAKHLADQLRCPILLLHTFCDQTDYPISYVQSIMERYSGTKQEKEMPDMHAVLFREWKSQKEEAIAQVFGRPLPSASCAFSLHFQGILPDGTNVEDGITSNLQMLLLSSENTLSNIRISIPNNIIHEQPVINNKELAHSTSWAWLIRVFAVGILAGIFSSLLLGKWEGIFFGLIVALVYYITRVQGNSSSN